MVVSQKKILRLVMKEKRRTLFKNHPEAGDAVCSHFFNFFTPSPALKVGSYWPMGSELDVRPLLFQLLEKGIECGLPCVTEQGLVFRRWTEATVLIKGSFSVYEPPASAPLMLPDLVLVPLLAFDKRGHRLGYGQGHFDNYLHRYPTKTIGVGFSEQEVEQVPTQAQDFALDFILTERGIRNTTKRKPLPW